MDVEPRPIERDLVDDQPVRRMDRRL